MLFLRHWENVAIDFLWLKVHSRLFLTIIRTEKLDFDPSLEFKLLYLVILGDVMLVRNSGVGFEPTVVSSSLLQKEMESHLRQSISTLPALSSTNTSNND